MTSEAIGAIVDEAGGPIVVEPILSTNRRPARSRSGSWRAASATATFGRATTATGACPSRCFSVTKAPASSSRSVTAWRACGPAIAWSCRGPSRAAPVGRASAGYPGAAPTRGSSAPAPPSTGWRPARRGPGLRNPRDPHRGPCGTGDPAAGRHPARSRMPARVRGVHRCRGRDPDREGVAGCLRGGDRPRRHRSVRDAGSEDRGRGTPDRDRRRSREAGVGHRVGRDRRRRRLRGGSGRRGARSHRRRGRRRRVRGDRACRRASDRPCRCSLRGNCRRDRRPTGAQRRALPGVAPTVRRTRTRRACSSPTAAIHPVGGLPADGRLVPRRATRPRPHGHPRRSVWTTSTRRSAPCWPARSSVPS